MSAAKRPFPQLRRNAGNRAHRRAGETAVARVNPQRTASTVESERSFDLPKQRLYAIFAGTVVALMLGVVAMESSALRDWRYVDLPLHGTLEAAGALAAIVMDVFHAVTVPGRGFVLLHGAAGLVGGFWFALTWVPRCATDTDAPWKRWMPGADILKSYDLNANCFITKPVVLDNFIRVVKSIESFWLTVVTLPPGETP
jgi:hypothetical protein